MSYSDKYTQQAKARTRIIKTLLHDHNVLVEKISTDRYSDTTHVKSDQADEVFSILIQRYADVEICGTWVDLKWPKS